MCHVPPIDSWQALSSFRRFGVSNGATPGPIGPAVRALFPKMLGHTYWLTDWLTDKHVRPTTPFLIANRHLFTSDRQIALVSSAGIPLRQRSPHIDIVHLYKARGIENRHSAPCWHWSQNLGCWMSMPKLNAPADIHWRRSNMNTRDPILMKSVEVLKDCRSLNAAAEMNCPMPRSVEKVPVRNEKRCIFHRPTSGNLRS